MIEAAGGGNSATAAPAVVITAEQAQVFSRYSVGGISEIGGDSHVRYFADILLQAPQGTDVATLGDGVVPPPPPSVKLKTGQVVAAWPFSNMALVVRAIYYRRSTQYGWYLKVGAYTGDVPQDFSQVPENKQHRAITVDKSQVVPVCQLTYISETMCPFYSDPNVGLRQELKVQAAYEAAEAKRMAQANAAAAPYSTPPPPPEEEPVLTQLQQQSNPSTPVQLPSAPQARPPSAAALAPVAPAASPLQLWTPGAVVAASRRGTNVPSNIIQFSPIAKKDTDKKTVLLPAVLSDFCTSLKMLAENQATLTESFTKELAAAAEDRRAAAEERRTLLQSLNQQRISYMESAKASEERFAAQIADERKKYETKTERMENAFYQRFCVSQPMQVMMQTPMQCSTPTAAQHPPSQPSHPVNESPVLNFESSFPKSIPPHFTMMAAAQH